MTGVRGTGSWVVVAALVGVAGCGFFGDDEVVAGTCLNRVASAEEERRLPVEPVSCDRPHEIEVAGYVDADELGADFPGEQQLSRFGLESCITVFEEYAGISYGRSTLELDIAGPTEEQWGDGARRVRCDIVSLDGTPRESSVRPAER